MVTAIYTQADLDAAVAADFHAYARQVADTLKDPDKKQLRFNDIVRVAVLFYPSTPKEGIRELIMSCCRQSDLHVKGSPMWDTLEMRYQWMLPIRARGET